MAEPKEEPENGPMHRGRGSRPVPDPTAMTSELVENAIRSLRETLEARMQGNNDVLFTRLEGMDKAIRLQEVWRETLPLRLKEETAHLHALLTEKIDKLADVTMQQFSGIAIQFQERDKRTEQLSLADKTAIAAALQAQKEAAGATNESNTTAQNKMESSFAKLLEQLATLIATTSRNTDDKINDVKSRLDKGEGKSSVADPATLEAVQRLTASVNGLSIESGVAKGHAKGGADTWAYIAVAISALVGVGGLALSFAR